MADLASVEKVFAIVYTVKIDTFGKKLAKNREKLGKIFLRFEMHTVHVRDNGIFILPCCN